MGETAEQSWNQATDLNGYHVVVTGCALETERATAKQVAAAGPRRHPVS